MVVFREADHNMTDFRLEDLKQQTSRASAPNLLLCGCVTELPSAGTVF
jgi:hypothetical protein